MSFADWLGKIQKKPYKERVKLLWILVAVSMVFVVLLWFVSFNRTIVGGGEREEVSENESLDKLKEGFQEAKEEIPGLWSVLKGVFTGSESGKIKIKEDPEEIPSDVIFKEDLKDKNPKP